MVKRKERTTSTEKYSSGLAHICRRLDVEIHRMMTARMPPGKGSVSRPMMTSSATSSTKTASKNGPAEPRPCSILGGVGWPGSCAGVFAAARARGEWRQLGGRSTQQMRHGIVSFGLSGDSTAVRHLLKRIEGLRPAHTHHRTRYNGGR